MLKIFEIDDETLRSLPDNLRDEILDLDSVEFDLSKDPENLEFRIEQGSCIGDTRAAINWAQTEGQISSETAGMLRHVLLGYE